MIASDWLCFQLILFLVRSMFVLAFIYCTGKADSDELHECLPDLFINHRQYSWSVVLADLFAVKYLCSLFKGLNHTGEKLSFTLKSSSCKIPKILRLYQGTEVNVLILQKYVPATSLRHLPGDCCFSRIHSLARLSNSEVRILTGSN